MGKWVLKARNRHGWHQILSIGLFDDRGSAEKFCSWYGEEVYEGEVGVFPAVGGERVNVVSPNQNG